MRWIICLILLRAASCHSTESMKSGNQLLEELRECQQGQTDTKLAKEQIIGRWIYEGEHFYSMMPGAPQEPTEQELKAIELEFKADGTFHLYKNGQLNLTTRWTYMPDKKPYQFQIDALIEEAQGIVEICDQQLAFMNSYADGVDYFYRKKEQQ